MAEPISAAQWARRFAARPPAERYGVYTHRDLPKLELTRIAELSWQSGIHPDVLGPCRRAAAKLNWIIMFRPIKPAAMEQVGEFAKLPKPEAIKLKADRKTGLVKLKNQQALERAIRAKKVLPDYAEKHGLKVNAKGFLVNKRGQKYFSDMDLYQVLDGNSGRPIAFGDGSQPYGGVKNRRELDTLINLLRPLGTDFALIQHGPQLQWVDHDSSEPDDEPVTAFCPDGEILILPPPEIAPFLARVGTR